MGSLLDIANQKVFGLEAEYMVGRSARSELCIKTPLVSLQHAAIRWTGDLWEVKDLGSRNGTYLNGRRLEPGQDYRLARGDTLAFGDPTRTWEVCDDEPPCVMVIALNDGDMVTLAGDMLGIPSHDEPLATIYRGADGLWRLECSDRPLRVLQNKEVFEVSGRSWRFACPEIISVTRQSTLVTRIEDLKLHFAVSLDEEHVQLRAECPSCALDLGSRGHNYLLLTLARQRLDDAERGLSPTACGWMLLEQLTEGLKTTPQQLNLDVHRIRVQFAEAGIIGAVGIVERRHRAKQLRIGVGALEISRL